MSALFTATPITSGGNLKSIQMTQNTKSLNGPTARGFNRINRSTSAKALNMVHSGFSQSTSVKLSSKNEIVPFSMSYKAQGSCQVYN